MVRALPVHAPARRAATKRVLALADSGRQIVDDIFLPGGLEELVARSSRRRTLAPSARLIAVTGYAQPEDLKVVAGGNVARDLSSQFYAPIGCPRAAASQGGDEDDHAVPCKGCILVVDDDPDLRNALTECFEALGCTVVAAVDGVHAVECLGDSLKPCLALLDLNMPRLDGAGLAAFVPHPLLPQRSADRSPCRRERIGSRLPSSSATTASRS